MNDDGLMRRLRAARPVDAEPVDHEALFERIVAEPGDPRLVEASYKRSSGPLGQRARLWTRARSRVLAGGTLALAGVAAALVLALSGSAAPPAFAITRSGNGSVLVVISPAASVGVVNRRLAATGIHEQITIYMATGPAAAVPRRLPVSCAPAPRANVSGPPLRVAVGKNGIGITNEIVGNGGVYHLDRCVVTATSGSGNPGAG
jgi:hypothetical protein